MTATRKPRNAQKPSTPGIAADTMHQAASVLQVDVAVLKWAKRNGCPAFRGSRVYLEEARAWIKQHEEEIKSQPLVTKEDVQIKLGLQKLARGEWEWERDRGKFISKEQAAQTLKQIAQHQRAILQRKLEAELPPKLVGLGVIEITQTLRETVDEICRILHDRTQPWETQAQPN